MNTYTVTVLLSQDFRATCVTGYDPEVEYKEVGTFVVAAGTADAACEVAYSVCNSYPGELHCDQRYGAIVASYRRNKNRSLSVGDAVRIDSVQHSEVPGDAVHAVGELHAVADCGFKAVA